MLLRFKHVFNHYNKTRLIDVLKNIIILNNLIRRILIIIADNVVNNNIIHKNLVKAINEHHISLIQNSQKVSCLAYVI